VIWYLFLRKAEEKGLCSWAAGPDFWSGPAVLDRSRKQPEDLVIEMSFQGDLRRAWRIIYYGKK
jgi:hypothetical protein